MTPESTRKCFFLFDPLNYCTVQQVLSLDFIEPLSRFPKGGPLPVITGFTTPVSRVYNLISDWYC